ncbi:DmpA family aminopeptidase [Castellaniella caeni]|uniref:DmpA family aminopeptidase n=1 Tax=Castellaniella caeni TaxID=266123 RepID=UPI0008346EE3|nr:P1 family peptidase [Castellaniella caeni]
MTTENTRPRARTLGIPLDGQPGPFNAITDVSGVDVGYTTLFEGDHIRTGVTAILPRGAAKIGVPCAAASYVFNGNGEMTGRAWVDESGSVNMPIMITNTHAVGAVHEGVIRYACEHHPAIARDWLLPIVGETWDGYLNDMNGLHVRPEHAVQAIEAARSGSLAEGSVGGGTGMNCYGYKGGSGTSSRLVPYGDRTYTVGVFLQSNFGGREELVVAGHPVGRQMLDDNPMRDTDWLTEGAGSVIAVVATDAPLLPLQCRSLAKRIPVGLARTGTSGSHFSGDLFIAFSTANEGALSSRMGTAPGYEQLTFIPWSHMDPFFTAVAQAVEEAVLNSLVANEDMIGRNGHRTPGIPITRLLQLVR